MRRHGKGGITNLERRSHELEHQPEDLAAYVKNSVHRTSTVSGDAQTQVELDCLEKGRGLVALGISNGTYRGGEDGNVIVEEGVDEVQRDQLGAHGLATDVVELIWW